jgi:predicted RNA-binding Zn-ribbon protein involved in translation (DUF1610 family)
MTRYCPECGNKAETSEEQTRSDEAYPDVLFKDLVMYCQKCGFTTSSVLTKLIPNK